MRLHATASIESSGEAGHVELIDRLLQERSEGPGDPLSPDLVMLAYPDHDPSGYLTAASYLNMRTGGRAHSFAVSGEGAAGATTAVGIAQAYGEAGRSTSSLLVLAQVPGPGQPVGSAVMLHFDGGPGSGTVEIDEQGGELTTRLAALSPGGPVLVVTGEEPSGRPDGVTVHRPAGSPGYGGEWLDLARHWSRWQHEYAVVVVHPAADTGRIVVLRNRP
ncbi:hypothetical protein [Kineosporia sp. NBRC 101731]|uniref:hypothetical protein n=1 Tax=Kineosporia sp. NBRC 101731 TaxID=3032199 RepID=UPI00249FA210|nr:hypothetical protein [Kineosporia sp. NBRC 101731]GLY32464.1 hypothetical protein Kisp02_58290 [Kineosporia sp. NBRC 101731]